MKNATKVKYIYNDKDEMTHVLIPKGFFIRLSPVRKNIRFDYIRDRFLRNEKFPTRTPDKRKIRVEEVDTDISY